jgi:hypothetical protein
MIYTSTCDTPHEVLIWCADSWKFQHQRVQLIDPEFRDSMTNEGMMKSLNIAREMLNQLFWCMSISKRWILYNNFFTYVIRKCHMPLLLIWKWDWSRLGKLQWLRYLWNRVFWMWDDILINSSHLYWTWLRLIQAWLQELTWSWLVLNGFHVRSYNSNMLILSKTWIW